MSFFFFSLSSKSNEISRKDVAWYSDEYGSILNFLKESRGTILFDDCRSGGVVGVSSRVRN